MEVQKKLDFFIEEKKIPHIIFHGCGDKRRVLQTFINKVYNHDKELMKKYVLYINCAHGKGIRFIRGQLKFFAKMNIKNDGGVFKSIVLFDADKLTNDAQSALRRCIELFSHTTRFFMVIIDIDKILKPILSRFCSIYIHNLDYKTSLVPKRYKWLKNKLMKRILKSSECIELTSKIYNKGYNVFDLFKVMENELSSKKKYEYLVYFDNIRTEFRNEKLLIFYIIYTVFMRHDFNFEI